MDVQSQMTGLIWILTCTLLTVVGIAHANPTCLTGVMTDVQSWVDEKGALTKNVDASSSIDLSDTKDPRAKLRQILLERDKPVKFMSMARCGLTRIPTVFIDVEYGKGLSLSETLETLSFYGNNFIGVSISGQHYDVELLASGARQAGNMVQRWQGGRSLWSMEFQRIKFPKLKELDLRSCGIDAVEDRIFQNLPKLEALYLGGNRLRLISSHAFSGLTNLMHLDISRNYPRDERGHIRPMLLEHNAVFSELINLKSLDLSNATISRITPLRSLGKKLERLSLCHIGSLALEPAFFNGTSLKVLDISGNFGILNRPGVLDGLQDTLEILSASQIGLTSFDVFENFHKLEILNVTTNEIVFILTKTASTLKRLQVLDVSHNRLISWFNYIYSYMKHLLFLDLRGNSINMISDEMISDFAQLSFLGLTGNSMICNCNSKDFIEMALRNEFKEEVREIKPRNPQRKLTKDNRFNAHRAFDKVNNIIANRSNMSHMCANGNEIRFSAKTTLRWEGNFLLIDYDDLNAYSCLEVSAGVSSPFANVTGCLDPRREPVKPTMKAYNDGRKLLALLVIPAVLLPALMFAYMFRRNLKYCLLTMRNSTLLSMVNRNKVMMSDDTIFNYDVFVSYCNDDRPWVLDQLLSHLENECSVSLCLHERDFQVGLSILENIVSCIDRSKSIMLVISQKFLLSQWCQFEMHLAQHRLLETRREDLILILLEDIPRRLRPNTLHYLMLTKTYIVWPKNKAEEPLFWKRLKKSVVTQQQKQDERQSLA